VHTLSGAAVRKYSEEHASSVMQVASHPHAEAPAWPPALREPWHASMGEVGAGEEDGQGAEIHAGEGHTQGHEVHEATQMGPRVEVGTLARMENNNGMGELSVRKHGTVRTRCCSCVCS
jgi:hypothetical protein